MGYWSDVDIAMRERPRRPSPEAIILRECQQCQQRVALPVRLAVGFTVCDRCRQAKEPSA